MAGTNGGADIRFPPAWNIEGTNDPMASLGASLGVVNPAYLSYSKVHARPLPRRQHRTEAGRTQGVATLQTTLCRRRSSSMIRT